MKRHQPDCGALGLQKLSNLPWGMLLVLSALPEELLVPVVVMTFFCRAFLSLRILYYFQLLVNSFVESL